MENLENFVPFTLNLIPKSMKIHHFLFETSQFDFLRLNNTFFFQNFVKISEWAYDTNN